MKPTADDTRSIVRRATRASPAMVGPSTGGAVACRGCGWRSARPKRPVPSSRPQRGWPGPGPSSGAHPARGHGTGTARHRGELLSAPPVSRLHWRLEATITGLSGRRRWPTSPPYRLATVGEVGRSHPLPGLRRRIDGQRPRPLRRRRPWRGAEHRDDLRPRSAIPGSATAPSMHRVAARSDRPSPPASAGHSAAVGAVSRAVASS